MTSGEGATSTFLPGRPRVAALVQPGVDAYLQMRYAGRLRLNEISRLTPVEIPRYPERVSMCYLTRNFKPV